jgi:hypothetical protein
LDFWSAHLSSVVYSLTGLESQWRWSIHRHCRFFFMFKKLIIKNYNIKEYQWV